jgi:hypothetical protein
MVGGARPSWHFRRGFRCRFGSVDGGGIGISLKRSVRLSVKNRMLARASSGSGGSCMDMTDEDLAKSSRHWRTDDAGPHKDEGTLWVGWLADG